MVRKPNAIFLVSGRWVMRDQIIDTALALFDRDGFNFKLDDLAKVLHISKKTIYKYFKNKEDIFRTVIIESFDSTHEMQKKIFSNPTLTTEQKLIGILSSRSKYESQVSIEKTMDIRNYYPDLYGLIMKGYMSQWDRVDALMKQGIKEQVFRADINVELVKTLLMDGMQMMHKDNLLRSSGLTYREAITQLIAIIMDGIRIR